MYCGILGRLLVLHTLCNRFAFYHTTVILPPPCIELICTYIYIYIYDVLLYNASPNDLSSMSCFSFYDYHDDLSAASIHTLECHPEYIFGIPLTLYNHFCMITHWYIEENAYLG